MTAVLPQGALRLLLASFLAITTASCSSCHDPGPDPGDGSVDASGDARVIPVGCGDGTLATTEACDDANNADGDGCSWNCATIDPHFICPTPGHACIRIVTCGNARIEGDETCDDHNTVANDGCDADCHKQPGWTCAPVGVACVAAECGDGIVAGFESCDDDDAAGGDGCDADCQLEPGHHCPTPGAMCLPTTCGDGMRQGTEHCDDGNPEVGDGCDPLCHREPDCNGGACVAVCGDGVKWAPEACDDGNTVGGDGCAANCRAIEPGFSCVEHPLPAPASVILPVTYRDFIANCDDTDLATSNTPTARLSSTQAGAVAPFGHPDFDCFNGASGTQTDGNQPDLHMVQNTLDSQGKPVLGTETGLTASAASFAQWYRTTTNVNLAIAQTLTLNSIGGGQYQFPDTSFFPITNLGWALVDCDANTVGLQPCEGTREFDERFFFTSEAHFWFAYKGDGSEILTFLGDDDVWVFIDGKLVVDIGGVHGAVQKVLDLDTYVANCNGAPDPAYCEAPLPLQVGHVYEGVVFQAERHVTGSNYTLTLAGFTAAPSVCTDDCGDSMVSSREACDLGPHNGNGDGSAYGGCTSSCTFEPYCGDHVVDSAYGEICDDGINLGGNASSCAPGCKTLGAVCGDGVVQTNVGEQCDDGNTTSDDGCSSDCFVELE